MRSPSPLLAIGMIAVAAPAFGQESNGGIGDVAVAGSVAPVCILGEPSQTVLDLGLLIETAGARVGRLDDVGDRSVVLPGSFCNFAGSIATIEASGLVEASGNGTAIANGFSRVVNYAASASTWGGNAATTTTSGAADGSGATTTGTSAVQPLPRITDIVVDLGDWTVPGDALLVAGNYSGVVRITLGPAAIVQ